MEISPSKSMGIKKSDSSGRLLLSSMFHNFERYPTNAVRVLQYICDTLGHGKPTYRLEKGQASRDKDFVGAYQVTCELDDGMLCSAIGDSTTQAIHGCAFRMACHLMEYVSFEDLAILLNITVEEGMDKESRCLLMEIMSLADPSKVMFNALEEPRRNGCGLEVVEVAEAAAVPPESISEAQQFDIKTAGSTLFSLLGCAGTSTSSSCPNSASQSSDQLLSLPRTSASSEITSFVALSNSSGGDSCSSRSESREGASKGAISVTKAVESQGNGSLDLTTNKSKSGFDRFVDGVSKVKQYCDRRGCKYSYSFEQIPDSCPPYFKAVLKIEGYENEPHQESYGAEGHGRTKKSAKQAAAFKMLEQIDVI